MFACFRFFQKEEEVDENIGVEEERPNAYSWWHKKLADFFEGIDNIDRLVEVRTASLRPSRIASVITCSHSARTVTFKCALEKVPIKWQLNAAQKYCRKLDLSAILLICINAQPVYKNASCMSSEWLLYIHLTYYQK